MMIILLKENLTEFFLENRIVCYFTVGHITVGLKVEFKVSNRHTHNVIWGCCDFSPIFLVVSFCVVFGQQVTDDDKIWTFKLHHIVPHDCLSTNTFTSFSDVMGFTQ